MKERKRKVKLNSYPTSLIILERQSQIQKALQRSYHNILRHVWVSPNSKHVLHHLQMSNFSSEMTDRKQCKKMEKLGSMKRVFSLKQSTDFSYQPSEQCITPDFPRFFRFSFLVNRFYYPPLSLSLHIKHLIYSSPKRTLATPIPRLILEEHQTIKHS